MPEYAWDMPSWMEPYRPMLEEMIVSHATVEEMVHRYDTDKHLHLNNTFVYADALATVARVTFLNKLYLAGKLVTP